MVGLTVVLNISYERKKSEDCRLPPCAATREQTGCCSRRAEQALASNKVSITEKQPKSSNDIQLLLWQSNCEISARFAATSPSGADIFITQVHVGMPAVGEHARPSGEVLKPATITTPEPATRLQSGGGIRRLCTVTTQPARTPDIIPTKCVIGNGQTCANGTNGNAVLHDLPPRCTFFPEQLGAPVSAHLPVCIPLVCR